MSENDAISDIEDIEQKQKRTEITKETVNREFDELLRYIQEEIDDRRKNGMTRAKLGIKYLQGIKKRLKIIQTHSTKVMKYRRIRNGHTKSGFNAPVFISEELAKFTGWNINEPHTRAKTTKFLCNYIKKRNLQNPDNGREILVQKDPKLHKLLGYDPETDDKPLTYARIQKYICKHYIKK